MARRPEEVDRDALDAEIERLEAEIAALSSEEEHTASKPHDRAAQAQSEVVERAADPSAERSETDTEAAATSPRASESVGLVIWVLLAVALVQSFVFVWVLNTLDSPTASPGPARFGSAIILATSGFAAYRTYTATSQGDLSRMWVILPALAGAVAGLFFASGLESTLSRAGSFLYFGPAFDYLSIQLYVAGPLVLVFGGFGLFRLKRRASAEPATSRGIIAAPLALHVGFHTAAAGWIMITADTLAHTARQAYRESPNLALVGVLLVLALVALATRRTGRER